MPPDDVRDKVVEILVELVGVNAADVTDSSILGDDLDMDALDLVELVLALEDAFGIQISDEEIAPGNLIAGTAPGDAPRFIPLSSRYMEFDMPSRGLSERSSLADVVLVVRRIRELS